MNITPRSREPFFIEGNRDGCLLIHGFSGSPGEVRPLGEYLSRLGFTVIGIRLAGHGTKEEDLEQTQWMDWHRSVKDGYNRLKSKCDRVFVIGFSMGGILAIKLAIEENLDGLVSIAAPIFLRDWRIKILPLLMKFKNYHYKKRSYKLDEDVRIYVTNYRKIPLVSVKSMLELIAHVKRELHRITCPVLVIQPRKDGSVKPESAAYIYKNIGSEIKKLVWFENSRHLIVLDKERKEVFLEIKDFLYNIANTCC